jgi:hypothetical protein
MIVDSDDLPTSTSIARQLDVVERLVSELEVPLHHLSSPTLSSNDLISMFDRLGKLLPESERIHLLLAGSFLDEAITVISLEALMRGWNVHILTDAVVARNPTIARVTEMRLLLSGAVPTSLRQIAYQWLVAETSDSKRGILRRQLEVLS